MLSTFPHLTEPEFHQACTLLSQRFQQRGRKQNDWTSVEVVHQRSTCYLRITTPLKQHDLHHNYSDDGQYEDAETDGCNDEDPLAKIEEHDTERLFVSSPPPTDSPSENVEIIYTILLSATYSVPTLYIHISDPCYRYPPTMTTLYTRLMPPQYRAQSESVGVLGGVTVGEHPVTGRPEFFVHPCQTAGVMEEVVDRGRMQEVGEEDYLLLWMGAVGGCVGLCVPGGLMSEEGMVKGVGC